MADLIPRRHFLKGATAGVSLMLIPGVGRIQAEPFPRRDIPGDYEGRLCYNENPLGPSRRAKRALVEHAALAHRYPDWRSSTLEDHIADYHGVNDEHVCAGAGATEIIRLVADAFLGPGDEMITATPTYTSMGNRAIANGATVINTPLTSDYRYDVRRFIEALSPNTRMISIVNPNNPTGTILRDDEIDFLFAHIPNDIIVVQDEAYHDFVDHPAYASCIPRLLGDQAVVVIRTMSKAFGLAGARVGYSLARADLTEMIADMQNFATVSRSSQKAGIAALEDLPHVQATVDLNNEARAILEAGALSLGLDYIPSETNFMMIDSGMTGSVVVSALGDLGYRVRSGWGMSQHIRVSTGTIAETEGFLDALDIVLNQRAASVVNANPAVFSLERIYPNPFNDRCQIPISTPGTGEAVALDVYDLQGRKIRSLVNRDLKAGEHRLIWDGRDMMGRQQAAGVYVVLLRQGEFAATQEITLLR